VHYKPESDEERARFAAAEHRRVGGELKTREELGMTEAEWAEMGEEACIGCKMCEKICPSDVISVKPGGRKEDPTKEDKKRGYCADFTLDLNACIVCELCVQVCPTDAILMLKVQEPPSYSREALVLTMDKLYDNEKLDQNYWASGSVLVGMQDPPKPPKRAKK
jgi:formate hydrogenlyase subunit 6/NADH:ubiquinone oxidoreductase subunit I